MRKTAPVNRTDEVPDELALIQSERISTQWTNELRKNIRVYPTCNILKAILSLDVYTQTVVYAFLIKGWSSSRIAGTFGRFSYNDSRDIGKRPRTAEEKTC